MKVLLLNSARKFIGEAAHCLALAEQLRARGHEVTLGVRREFELAERARGCGVETLELEFNSGFHPIKDGRDWLRLRRFIRERGVEVVHCHRGKDHWLAAAAGAGGRRHGRRGGGVAEGGRGGVGGGGGSRGGRGPALVRTRHVVVPMAAHRLNQWLMGRRTDGLMAVSGAARGSLEGLGAAVVDRTRVVLSAVDQERFSPGLRSVELRLEMGVGPQDGLVGLVARLQNVKGQEVFLRAAAGVAKGFPRARFLVAGRGTAERFGKLERLARELGIEDRVIFRGWLRNVEQSVASLDVGVVASLGSEGSSRMAFECMASGTALVATRVGALPEIVEDGRTGVLVKPGDVAGLAEGIGRVLGSGELRRSLAEGGLTHVREHHTFDRWIEEIVAIYEEALGGTGEGSAKIDEGVGSGMVAAR